ncbi:hypothetical protein KY285_000824 [Solanum tuberosum]|nr:hypothetical protein KY289_001011 [Solanum tuberosum]KAH0764953.1 hypothetical protein KY285_000824 [Solanum tuberosum]
MATKYLNLRFKFGGILDLSPTEGQISQSLSQVGESFNAHGEYDGYLTAQLKYPDLGLGSSSTFPSSDRVENDGVAGVQQEIDDGYSSIYWTDTVTAQPTGAGGHLL